MVLMRGAAEDVDGATWFHDRIWPMEANLTGEHVLAGARLACAEMLLGGVTAFADHYFDALLIARAARELGIRADLAPTFFSEDGDAGRDAAFDDVRALAESADALVRVSVGPHAVGTVDDRDLEAAATLADELGLRVHLHASESVEQTAHVLATRGGRTPIRVLHDTGVLERGALIAHGCGILPEDVDDLAAFADRLAVASCPKGYLKQLVDPMTPVPLLRAAGVPLAIGSDGAASGNTLDVWEAARLTALTQKRQQHDAGAMPVRETLDAIWRGGAAALGRPELGRLDVGAAADLALVDVSGPHCRPIHDLAATLLYSVRASDVQTVVVGGRVVVRDRALLTADLGELIAHAEALVPSLLQRRGTIAPGASYAG
jgi:5-methylthioadenosine/S-adenosylhomocysteine deaminase